jgi:hypothetical protein
MKTPPAADRQDRRQPLVPKNIFHPFNITTGVCQPGIEILFDPPLGANPAVFFSQLILCQKPRPFLFQSGAPLDAVRRPHNGIYFRRIDGIKEDHFVGADAAEDPLPKLHGILEAGEQRKGGLRGAKRLWRERRAEESRAEHHARNCEWNLHDERIEN